MNSKRASENIKYTYILVMGDPKGEKKEEKDI